MRAALGGWILAAALGLGASPALAQHHRRSSRDEAPADASVVAAADASVVAAAPEEAEALTALPRALGLPVNVQVAVRFVEVQSVDENDEAFQGTADVRLQWDDPRLSFPASEAVGGAREWLAAPADARLAEIWSPEVRIANLVDEPRSQTRGLRIESDGHVELMLRTTGTFHSSFDAQRFPFDSQRLQVVLVCQRETLRQVALDFRQDDLDFSAEPGDMAPGGWTSDLVTLRRDPLGGWHGATHARVYAELEVTRVAARTAPAIFIPLLASLLIPLLAVWLNRVRRGAFAVEAFELTNVVVGGLFAVIALNFTVNAEYKVIASGDNTVSRLFALNYLTLGVSLLINIALYRFNVVARYFGPMVEEQVYRVCLWAVPLLSLATAVGMVAAAIS